MESKEKDYYCEICKKFFECEQFLRMHEKLKHPHIVKKQKNICNCPPKYIESEEED